MKRPRALGMIYPNRGEFAPRKEDDFLLFTQSPRPGCHRFFWIRNYQTSTLLYEFSELFMPVEERRNDQMRYDVRYNLIPYVYNSV